MTTGQAILLDHLAALLTVAAWLAAGVAVALRRVRLGLGLLVAAVLVTLTRVATVAMLAGRGWWFVQEKVLLGLPMLGAAGLAAVLIAGRRLVAARRTANEALPASSVVAPLTAAYAALAGLVVTFLARYPLTSGTALITVSIVCLGALLTACVVATDADDAADDAAGDDAPAPAPDGRPGFSRRRFMVLAGGAVVVGAASAGAGLSFRPTEPVSTGGGAGCLVRSGPAVSVTDLRGARSPVWGGARRRHVLTARAATVRLPSGRDIDAWTYDG